MALQQPERRLILERRLLPDRRRGLERRIAERRRVVTPALVERRLRAERQGVERRSFLERRSAIERRVVGETVDEHIRNALQLLGHVSESRTLPDEEQRDLDAAMRRLRVALHDTRRSPERQVG